MMKFYGHKTHLKGLIGYIYFLNWGFCTDSRSVQFRQSGLLSLRASHSRSKRYGTERERKPNCLSLCIN